MRFISKTIMQTNKVLQILLKVIIDRETVSDFSSYIIRARRKPLTVVNTGTIQSNDSVERRRKNESDLEV